MGKTMSEHRKGTASAVEASRAALLATVGHEIRTPMTGVRSVAALVLEEGNLTERQRTLLDVLHRSASSLVTILDDLLDYARLDAEAVSLELRAFDLAEVIDDVVTLVTAAHPNERVRVRVDFPDHVPRIVEQDPTRVRQVLANLLSNALKFTRRGSVTVRVRQGEACGEATPILLQIVDTGIGIPADRIPRLFDAYTQADVATARRYGGTGLGLTIAKHLVELMGGSMHVDSRQGLGSIFTVTLPVKFADAVTEPTQELEPDAAFAAGTRALLVDDDILSRVVAEEMLCAFGCDVVAVEDGASALDALAEQRFDLVFVDCQMPEMDGYETVRRMREQLGLQTPVLAMTGDIDAADVAKARAAGMNGHLAKPVCPNDLAEVLRRWVLTPAA